MEQQQSLASSPAAILIYLLVTRLISIGYVVWLRERHHVSDAEVLAASLRPSLWRSGDNVEGSPPKARRFEKW